MGTKKKVIPKKPTRVEFTMKDIVEEREVADAIGQIAERTADAVATSVVGSELQILRNEVRKEITELKMELFKEKLVPAYRTAYQKYDNFEDNLLKEKFEDMLSELTLKTGRSPRALRIRIKNMGLLGV
jgi:hypothetical protein